MANILHIFRNLKFGGCQTLAQTLIKRTPEANHYAVYFNDGADDEEMLSQFQLLCKSVFLVRQCDGVAEVNASLEKIFETYSISKVFSWYFPYTLKLKSLDKKQVIQHVGTSAYGDSLVRVLKNSIIFNLYRAALRKQKLIAPSEHVVRSFEKIYFISRKKFTVIPNFVDSTKYENNNINDKNKDIVMVGRLDGSKDFDKFIEVANCYTGDYKFKIVGDGPDRQRLEEKCRAQGIRVSFLGARGDVPDILKRSQVSIFLNKKIEGFGNVILESLASGCITIVSDIGASREIIEHGIDGFRVSSVKEIIHLLSMIENNSYEKKEIVKNANNKMLSKFSEKKSIEKYMGMFL